MDYSEVEDSCDKVLLPGIKYDFNLPFIEICEVHERDDLSDLVVQLYYMKTETKSLSNLKVTQILVLHI